MPLGIGGGAQQGMLDFILEAIDSATYGNTRGGLTVGEDEYPPGTMKIGMAPMSPGDVTGMAGLLGKLKGLFRGGGKGGAYAGSAPLRGSQGVPHTSPLPNEMAPPRAPTGGPSRSGQFGDNMAGTIRGDIPPPVDPANEFLEMLKLGLLGP